MRVFKKYDLRAKIHRVFKKSYSLYFIAYCLSLLLPHTSSCQLLDSLSLDTMTAFTSVQQAMQQPDHVLKLDLSKEKLKDFPPDIRKLTNLQYLNLSKNKITEVPDWIGELTDLQFLILSKNKIDSLPDSLGKLVNLKYFIMNRSSLQSLPHTIGNLKQLIYLDLWDDNLSYFPPELKGLSGNLETLDLRDVLINSTTKNYLKSLLPNTNIFLSPSCPCEN